MRRLLAHRSARPLVLVLATLVWGASFVVTRAAVEAVPVLAFVALRFAVAAVLVASLTRPRLGRLTRREVTGGLCLGAAMLGGYTLQAAAMQAGLDSGRAAFISSLYVPLVPVLGVVLLRHLPSPRVWAGFGLACLGWALLAGRVGGGGSVHPPLLALAGALAIACEILLLGRFATQADPRRLAVVECATLAALCVALQAGWGTVWPAPHARWIVSSVGLGVASAGLQIAVNWAQQTVSPARATLIYTLEPVSAGVFGAMEGERMGLAAMVGAGLILVSIAVGREQGREVMAPAAPSAG